MILIIGIKCSFVVRRERMQTKLGIQLTFDIGCYIPLDSFEKGLFNPTISKFIPAREKNLFHSIKTKSGRFHENSLHFLPNDLRINPRPLVTLVPSLYSVHENYHFSMYGICAGAWHIHPIATLCLIDGKTTVNSRRLRLNRNVAAMTRKNNAHNGGNVAKLKMHGNSLHTPLSQLSMCTDKYTQYTHSHEPADNNFL